MSQGFTTVVHGVREVQEAFVHTSLKVDPAVGTALRALAKPVQQESQSLALQQVSNVGQPWSRMRIGRRGLTVYVAEKERGTKNVLQKRPNLHALLMDRALTPALRNHEAAIALGVRYVVDDLCRDAEREMFPV